MLPRTEHPTFPKTLPISGKTVRIRPMTIKDEKILMMVGETATDRLDSLKQVLTNCVVDDIDFDKLPFIDFQYLFISLRATSIDSVVGMLYRYGDKEYNVDINLTQPKFKNIEEFKKSNVVKFDTNKGIVFKSPTFFDIYNMPNSLKNNLDATDLIVKSIDSIFFGDDVFDSSTVSQAEMIELFDSLPAKVLKDINLFFSTLPSMYFEGRIKLEDGTLKDVEVTDFSDFF